MNCANGGTTLFRSSKFIISVISAILTLSWFDLIWLCWIKRKEKINLKRWWFFRKEKEKKDPIQNFMRLILVILTFQRAYRYVSICSVFFFLLSEIGNLFFTRRNLKLVNEAMIHWMMRCRQRCIVYLLYSQKMCSDVCLQKNHSSFSNVLRSFTATHNMNKYQIWIESELVLMLIKEKGLFG